MSDTKDIAEQLRNRINEGLGKEVAKSFTSTEELIQVSDWIEMPEYFTMAVGGKGFPCGHITQIIGESDSGKSTLMMHGMVETQRAGGVVFLVDSEHKFSFDRFRVMGGVPEDLIILPVDSLEEAWDAFSEVTVQVEQLRQKYPDIKILLAWDSVAASVPDSINDSEAGDAHVSVEAKINNKEIRKLRKKVKDNRIATVFINHSYWTMPKFGISKEVIKGGSEMFYMSTLILKTKRKGWIKRQVKGMDQKIGAKTMLEVFKGHLSGRKTQTEFNIIEEGIVDDERLKEYKNEIKGIV